MIEDSVSVSSGRSFDVFVGIDIFGRGTYGGGEFNAFKALQLVNDTQTSVALFAPAWTHERNPSQRRFGYERREEQFWLGKQWVSVLLNGDAENNLDYWNILNNGGQGWATNLDSAIGSKVFITSHDWCIKNQLVDLKNFFDREFLDTIPEIRISEYFCGTPPNYSDFYFLKVELRDENHNILTTFQTGELVCSNLWQHVTHLFCNYGKGLRYIFWEHGGKDAEKWGGHYGSKMTHASVLVHTNFRKTSKEKFPIFYKDSNFKLKEMVYYNIFLPNYQVVACLFHLLLILVMDFINSFMGNLILMEFGII